MSPFDVCLLESSLIVFGNSSSFQIDSPKYHFWASGKFVFQIFISRLFNKLE